MSQVQPCINGEACLGKGVWKHAWFLSDPGIPGPINMGLVVSISLSPTPFADLADVTLADEDNNSVLSDDVNRANIGNVEMEVVN